MGDFPYKPLKVDWKRPSVNRDILKQYSKRNNLQGLWHSLGVLAVLGMSGFLAYQFFETKRWFLMALALYIHGGLYAFNPQNHEFSHGAVFKSKWLHSIFKRIFGIVHWTANGALYKVSHTYHHQYTLHRQSEGEEVHPRPEMTQQILHRAIQVVDIQGLITVLYDQLYSLFRPYQRNSRRGVWQRYVYQQCSQRVRRDGRWTQISQLLFHVLFAVFAIATGRWFLIIVASLPAFYGGTWYHMWVHDTMHVGREPDSDDFRKCCRSVKIDPFTSFMYWHMEWHTEHHTFAAIPCYNLKNFHRRTREHWDPPQSLVEAWREMNRHSRRLLSLPNP